MSISIGGERVSGGCWGSRNGHAPGRTAGPGNDRIIALCEAGDCAAAATGANWQTLLPLLDTELPDGEQGATDVP